jgi:hypothetical protein
MEAGEGVLGFAKTAQPNLQLGYQLVLVPYLEVSSHPSKSHNVQFSLRDNICTHLFHTGIALRCFDRINATMEKEGFE